MPPCRGWGNAARALGSCSDHRRRPTAGADETIEAARAARRPRFAVVASEVKSLANQTAKATDEICQQIVSMQTVTTTAVSAIRNISNTISEINEVTTAIAAAVEEQGAATREIARNIQHAAGGTSEVSTNIARLSASSQADPPP